MLLFAISFLLIFISSYFITSVISPKKSILGIIYLFLTAFAQIVLTFEILSLFSAIKQYYVLGFNILFLIISIFIWNKNNRPIWTLDCKDFRNRVVNSFKLDKSLFWLYIGFGVFIISALILCLIMPITNADAQGYHVARSAFWVIQGNLNHFDTADVRNLCLPINSEILYAWVLLFIKKDVFLGFFSFVGYLLSIISVYNILGFLGYCTRKKLWVIFILSSLSSVIVQASGTETDIIIAGLITSSIFLFWYALKNNKKLPIFMSALSYALAVGTKTPALIMMPGVGLFMIALCFHFRKSKTFWHKLFWSKPFLWFLSFGFINFIIFSSYNYILNFLQFSNFMSSENYITVSKNYYGIKGLFSNFIKYIFMFFDFTGFRWSDYIGDNILKVRSLILHFFHLSGVKDGLYTTGYDVQRTLIEPMMGAGILGFLVYLPCLLWSLIKPIFKFKSIKTRFIFGFACLFFINLIVISYSLAYMAYSVRFIMSFLVLSSPVLVYSYLSKKNPLKYVIILFSLFYLMGVSTHLWARPLMKIIGNILIKHPSITYLRETSVCKDFEDNPRYNNSTCILRKKIKTLFSTDNKILVFLNSSDSVYLIKSLEFEGYKLDFRRLEDASNIDFNKYNLIITTKEGQTSMLITDYEARKNDYKYTKTTVIKLKDRLVPCIYVHNPTIPEFTKGKENPPYQSVCIINDKFLKKQNFEVIALAGVIKPNLGETNYYVILQNKNLPPKTN